MPTSWLVNYPLSPPLKVADQPVGLPTFGVRFSYDPDGLLTVISHEFSLHDTATEGEAFSASERALQALFAAMSFRSGVVVTGRARSVMNRATAMGTAQITIRTTINVSGQVGGTLVLSALSALPQAPSRLAVWLALANDARDSESAVDALRSYYMILEDIYGRNAMVRGHPADKIRLVRNFVSHGEPLGDPLLLQVVASELGYSASQYDPGNRDHVALIKRYRTAARELVVQALSAYC